MRNGNFTDGPGSGATVLAVNVAPERVGERCREAVPTHRRFADVDGRRRERVQDAQDWHVANCVFKELGGQSHASANAHAEFGHGWRLFFHPSHGPPVDFSDVGQPFFLGLDDAVFERPGLKVNFERIGEVDPIHGVLGVDTSERTALDHFAVDCDVNPLALDAVFGDLAGCIPSFLSDQAAAIGPGQFQIHNAGPFSTWAHH